MEQNSKPNWKSSPKLMMLFVVLFFILFGFCGFLCYKMISNTTLTKVPQNPVIVTDTIPKEPNLSEDSNKVDTIPVSNLIPEDKEQSLKLTGKVHNSEVEMHLRIIGNSVQGDYYYKNNESESPIINLTGQKIDNHIIMHEISMNKGKRENSGTFDGDLVSNVFSGKFHNYQKDKDFYFELFVRN